MNKCRHFFVSCWEAPPGTEDMDCYVRPVLVWYCIKCGINRDEIDDLE